MLSKRAKTKTTKKRPQCTTSNAFAMFDQSQVQEFKEALNVIDQNQDGFIDKEDLHDMFASLGKNPADEYLDAMMNEAPGPISFTTFLTMFGEKLMAQTQKMSSEMLLLALKKPRAPYRRTARESC